MVFGYWYRFNAGTNTQIPSLGNLNMKNVFKFLAPFLLMLSLFFGFTELASADAVAEATTALTSAKTDAQSIGGLIVGAVAVLAVVGLVISMLRKA